MSVGSDNKKLSVSPAVVPGISVDPPTPELNAKSSSPQKKRFLPNCFLFAVGASNNIRLYNFFFLSKIYNTNFLKMVILK